MFTIPTTTLTKIYRQDSASHGIRELCLDVLAGEIAFSKTYAGVDWFLCDSEDGVITAVVDCYLEEVKLYGFEQVLVIAPFKDQCAGVHAVNRAIRQRLGYDGNVPRVGEILLAHKNDYNVGLLNGMRLRSGKVVRLQVTGVEDGNFTACPLGKKREIVLPLRPHANGPCKTIGWGYCATVHKFQGSEAQSILVAVAPDVVKIIRGEPWHFDKSAIYTAFSRAKVHLTIVGDFSQLAEVIKFERRQRVTALRSLLEVA
jgi:ATP-dependent exoDNAse (exonuclease V) alpha subunit